MASTEKSQIFASVRWTSLSSAVSTILQVLQLLALTRLLAPADFGLMAVVSAIVLILRLFSDLGVGKAIIHYIDVSKAQLSSLYWLNIGTAVVLMVVMASSAPLIAGLFDDPRLAPILIVSSLMFPFGAAGHQFRMLAEKNLRFSELAIVEIGGALSGFASAIAVAIAGGGVWAIVVGMLTATACTSILAWWRLSAGWRPRFHLRLKECNAFLHFGVYSIGDSLANTVRMQMDVLIGGLLVGPAGLGHYVISRDLSLRVAFVINPIITRISFPVMARRQHDTMDLKRIYLDTQRMTASANFPLYVALVLFAEEIVTVAFGERWHDSVGYLQVFASLGVLRSTGNPSGSLLYAVGRTRRAFLWNAALLLITPPVLLVGTVLGGLPGLAWAMLVIQISIFVPSWYFLVRTSCGASLSEHVGAILPPLLIALGAIGCAYGAARGFDHALTRLTVGFLVGVVCYLALSARFNRPWVAAIKELLWQAGRGK